MSRWGRKTLGEFVSLQRGHDLTEPDRKPGSFPVMGSAGQNGFHGVALAKGPGVVIGRSGASFGQIHFTHEDYWPHNTCLYVTDFHDNDPRFVYYFQKSIRFEGYNSGSAQPSLSRNFIYPIQMHVTCDPDEQRAIANVLGCFDEKIELNRRMSQTLEVIAQAIFKSWFVDFEPVRAKASGESHESIAQRLGLAPAHLDLFPDLLVETDNGLAPEGWRLVTLKDLTTKIGSGATPRGGREVYVDEGVALIRSQNVYDSEFAWPGLARLTEEAAAQLANVAVQPDDVLLNITGASILRTCVVPQDVLPARVNQHVAIIRALADVPARYLHLHLLRPETRATLLGLNAGASREAVTKAHLESVRLLDPGAALLQRFDETVSPLYAQTACIAAQTRALGMTRDALLPRLLAGELQIGQAASA